VAATLDMFWSETSGEVFNIGSGQGITVSRLLQTMQDVGGDRRPMKQGPADWTAGSCRVADISKAREQLGWRPTTGLREGLERTFQFLRDEQPG
jgi:nucleoside-diphosphate-sugar epimerase